MKELNEEFKRLETKSAEDVIKWAVTEFKDKVALASSFGAEDVVLVDLLVKVCNSLGDNYKPRIFTLDTGRLPQETYDLMDEIKNRYRIELEVYFPDTGATEDMVRKYGFNLFYNRVAKILVEGIKKKVPDYHI